MRAVHRFVAACRPTGTATQERSVIATADEDLAWGRLVLEVALEAEGGVAFSEKLFVHGTMGLVTNEAAFAGGFVFVDERAALDGVTLEAGFIFTHERSSSGDNGVALVRIVAITAGHFAVEHRMSMGEVELAAFIQVAIETDFGGFVRVNDRVTSAAGLVVEAGGPVAGFTTHVDRVWATDLQFGVRGGGKIAGDVLVALRTRVGADEFRAWNFRWRNHRARDRRAGKQSDGRYRCEDNGDWFPGNPPDRCSIVPRIVPHEWPFCYWYVRVSRRLQSIVPWLSTTL
jgi:hypothetical protein